MFERAKISAVVAIAVCASAAAAQANAADLRLKYADLDMAQPAQVQTLDARIAQSAKAWCADQIVTGTRLHSNTCEAEARTALIEAMPASTQRAFKRGMAAQPATLQASIPAPPAAAR